MSIRTSGGNNKPRPAGPGKPRIGRPPDHMKFTSDDNVANVLPPASSFSVEGRCDIGFWSEDTRADFRKLQTLAARFGMQVIETSFMPLGERKRRKWDHKRIDLDYAFATIQDMPGILFDDWLKLWLEGVPETDSSLLAARKKASVALHKLYIDMRIDKRYADDGRLILYEAGKAPTTARARPGTPAREG